MHVKMEMFMSKKYKKKMVEMQLELQKNKTTMGWDFQHIVFPYLFSINYQIYVLGIFLIEGLNLN